MTALTAAFLFFFPLAAAAQDGQPADLERLGQDLLKNIDAWTGQVNGKLRANKPVGDADFDALFGENFLSGSEDPLRDLEAAQRRIEAGLSGDKRAFDSSFAKWRARRLAPSDLNPEVTSDADHVTVSLDQPAEEAESMKVDISGGLIRMAYARPEQRRVENPDGTVGFSSFLKTRKRAMAVPRGADPARYKVSAAGGKLRIVFDRLKKGSKKTEAAK